jgi:hypothetical protein
VKKFHPFFDNASGTGYAHRQAWKNRMKGRGLWQGQFCVEVMLRKVMLRAWFLLMICSGGSKSKYHNRNVMNRYSWHDALILMTSFAQCL